VNHGIQVVQGQKIFVTRRSVNIIKERQEYMWLFDKNDKVTNIPTPINNHHMDGIRYGISSLAPIIRRKELTDMMPRLEQRKNPAR